MYALLGISLGLAAYLAVGGVVSLPVAGARRRFRSSAATGGGGGQAGSLFALRLLPTMAGLLFVGLFYAPAYILLEPRNTGETVGPALVALAACAAGLFAAGLGRGVTAWVKTRRLAAGWREGARPLRLPGLPLPAYRITHPFPVVAVVGVLRPRLFVAEAVLAGLTEEELSAVLAHEAGHLVARDNLKNFFLRFCPDPLSLLPVGEGLCRSWAAAAEADADDHAARSGAERALALAGALVKVARMAPPGGRLVLPASAFHDGGSVAERVQRLLGGLEREPAAAPASPLGLLGWAYLSLLAGAAMTPPVLRGVHALTEAALRFLR